eukprot:gnl/MRDRNA2_/MRDRNA2_117634_c0_seq1.p1 gnl/MRDRNA2_/MRDRNA2_117634_c0~~gnl/MRDRNA2_/MRDRNA2_117634_c0_seq1.p1  ORF type:complete len:544 (-),score=116.98 gnl/MRDRNA2_/MRDRNA2_117634_c0_seq1:33-1664(-)
MSFFSSLLGTPTSGLPKQGCATPRQRPPAADQIGEWLYIVVDPKGIAPRPEPSYDKNFKETKGKLQEGELVRIHQRKPLANSETCFLRLAEGGWCYDVQPGVNSLVRMVEVTVEDVNSVYQVVAAKGVGIRNRPSFLQSAIVCRGPEKGEYVETCQRLVYADTTFLRLADGSGWVFDHKNGKQILQWLQDEPGLAEDDHAENHIYTDGPANNVVERKAAGEEGGRTQSMVTLWKMGFRDATLNQEALRACGGSLESAADWLLARQAEIEKENRKEDLQSTENSEKMKFSPPSRGAGGTMQKPGESPISADMTGAKDATSEGSTLPSSQKGDSPGAPTATSETNNSSSGNLKSVTTGSDSEDDDSDGVPEEAPVNKATPQRLSRRDQYTEGGRKRDASRKRSKSANRRKSGTGPTEQQHENNDDGDFDDDCGDVDEGTTGDGGVRVSAVRGGVDGTANQGSEDASTGKSSKRIRGRTPRQRRESEASGTLTPRQTSNAAKKVATPRGSKGAGKGAVPKRRSSSRRRPSAETAAESGTVNDEVQE